MYLLTFAISRSIRGKLALLIAISVGTAVVFSFAGSTYREIARFSEAKRAELQATAEVLAVAVADSVAGGNRAQATQALNAIGRMPAVRFAEIRDTNENVFAQAGSAVALVPNHTKTLPSAWDALTSSSFAITTPIVRGGVTRGSLTLLADTSELAVRLRQALVVAVASALFATLLALLIAARMQRQITGPIGELTSTMNKVRLTNDFSRRAERRSDDETGQLVDAFNDMLGQISARDAALDEHRAGLERTVDERTHQLAVARDAAELANKAKSDFLATMSHEIRTPLNGMLVMAELLARSELPPGEQRYADIISRSGQTLLSIINDILDLSKIEAGKLTLERVPVNPAKLVSDVLGLFWERANSKGIDLAAIISPDTPEEIEGDPVRLSQIMSNLVNNALKFTERGHVLVEVTVGGRASGIEIQFQVTDTGIGISADKVEQVFQPFSQADVSTARRFGGTGLGLSISQRLVAAMRGRIWVTSEPGEGSCFSFAVPAAVIKEAAPSNASLGRKAMLAVERGATRQAMAHGLKDAGYDVIPASPNIQALGTSKADIIVADAVLALRISQTSAATTPRVVVLCSLGEVPPKNAHGDARQYLTKPITSREVTNFLNQLESGNTIGFSAAPKAEQDSQPVFHNLHVLVADDSPVNQEVAREALKVLGATCAAVSDGAQAVEAWRNGDFSVVLMDCSMPILDGYAATREIRRIEEAEGLSRTPIVALTADVLSGTSSWQSVGMDSYLSKPFTLASLSHCLSHVQAASRWQQTVVPADSPVTDQPPKADGETPALDPGVLNGLRQMAGGSDAIVGKVLQTYLAHAPGRFDALQAAFRDGDLELIATEAHALKSPSRNVGAMRLGDLCQLIEDRARATDLSLLQQKEIDPIKVEFERTLRAANDIATNLREPTQLSA